MTGTPMPFTIENDNLQAKKFSFQFMITEFERIQAKELFNLQSGETRVNLYLRILSLVSVSIIALWQLINPQDPTELRRFYSITAGAFLFVSLVGILIFILLIERWRLSVIYLRKLARIRRWFLAQDPSLHNGLVYSVSETYPSFISKRLLSSSLITVIMVLNSLSVTGVIMFVLLSVSPSRSLQFLGLFATASTLAVLFMQGIFVWIKMVKMEKDNSSVLPSIKQENKKE